MKTLKMFEAFEVKQLLKGRIVDIGEGMAVGISPEAISGVTENEAVPRKKKGWKKGGKKRGTYLDRRRDEATEFYLKHFVAPFLLMCGGNAPLL